MLKDSFGGGWGGVLERASRLYFLKLLQLTSVLTIFCLLVEFSSSANVRYAVWKHLLQTVVTTLVPIVLRFLT